MTIESPLNPLTTNAIIFTITKDDLTVKTSITCPILTYNQYVNLLFGTRATYSIVSSAFAKRLERNQDVLSQGFTTTLSFEEVMMSTHWLRTVLMRIIDRELYSNLIVLKIYDYDLILSINFMGKYNTCIVCRRRNVVFDPEGDGQFELIGDAKTKINLFLSIVKAQKMLANG